MHGEVEDSNDVLFEDGKSGCLICQHGSFPKSTAALMEILVHGLFLGIARSEKEERSRRQLWDYPNRCRLIDAHELGREMEFYLDESAQELLLDIARSLKKNQTLTAEQEHPRGKLEPIRQKDLAKCAFKNGSYVFDIDRDDNERSELEQPLENGRRS